MRQSIVITAILWLAVGLLFCSHAHAQSITPSRGITGATTGGGLVVTSNKLGMLASCASGEVMGWNGTAWACTPNGTGDVTSVVAGDGLSGGGTSGALTLDVGAGTGITVGPNAISVNTTTIQARVTGTCSAGSSIRVIDAAGAVTCETDDNTTYSAGSGLTLMTGVFAIDPAYTQRRVSGTCAAGSAIATIAEDGTVTCETDTDTTYTAGDGLTLTGTDFDLTYTSDFTITSDQLDLSTAVTAPGTLSVAGETYLGGGDWYTSGESFNSGQTVNAEHTALVNKRGYLDGVTQFRNLQILDGKDAAACTFTGSTKTLNCVGGLQVNGTAVNTFTTDNAIPVGNGTGLMASSWTDDGGVTETTLSTNVATGAGAGVTGTFKVGADVYAATTARNGHATNVFSDGNLYLDHKVFDNGTINYRYGDGAQTGANGTWFSLATATGTTTLSPAGGLAVTGNLSTAASLTAGATTAANHVVNGKLQVNTAAGGQLLLVKGASNGGNDGAIQIKSNLTGWGDITGQLTVTSGGSTTTDNLRVSTDSGFLALRPGGGSDAFVVGHNGQLWGGDTAATAVSSNLDVFTLGNTGTAQTTSQQVLDVSHSGTFTTAAGNVEVVGVDSTMTTSVSTAGNTLVTIGVRGRALTNDTDSTANIGVVGYAVGTNTSAIGVNAVGSGANAKALVVESAPAWFTDSLIYTRGDFVVETDCGTGSAAYGTAQAGKIETGTGATGCVVTFQTTLWDSEPSCVVTARSGTQPVYTVNFDELTLTTAAPSTTYDYICMAYTSASAGGFHEL